MKPSTFYTVCSLAAVFISVVTAQTKPAFCKSLDCPPFTAQEFSGFEIRSYTTNTKWVTTSITTTTPNYGWMTSSRMFRKLFNYISGANAQGITIDMTTPVLTKIEELPNAQFEVTMMFYLTSSNPPNPTDPDVTVIDRPAGNVFVREFPKWWFASNSDYTRNVAALKASVGSAGLSTTYNPNYYFRAGYDSPWAVGVRQHEVWLDQATS